MSRIAIFHSFLSVHRCLLSRFLLVLKLVKQVPGLRMTVEALLNGFASLGYIAFFLFLLFYISAIYGVVMFKANDPRSFGSLHVSMISLYTCATLEGWTDVMCKFAAPRHTPRPPSPLSWIICGMTFTSFLVQIRISMGVTSTGTRVTRQSVIGTDRRHTGCLRRSFLRPSQ